MNTPTSPLNGSDDVLRVLIADDHQLVREAVAFQLEATGTVAVAQSEGLDEALHTIEADGPFDVAMVDLRMPGMEGMKGLTRVKAANAPNPVVLFSGVANSASVNEAMALGASGFFPKTMSARTLVNALRFVASGEIYMPASLMNAAPAQKDVFSDRLNDREKNVLRALCDGRSNKEIALAHNLSLSTTKTLVRSICRKLEADNRTHAAMIAKEAGWS